MSLSLQNCILYQDDSIIILNKPAGIPVHAGRGGGENLEQYLQQLCFDYEAAPKLAHRLDKDTSGCLILARTPQALSSLGKKFAAGRIKKTYWAVVCGHVENDAGTIDLPLRKQSPLKYKWWMEAHPDGLPSITHYKVLQRSGDYTLLELQPITGRTHQLRVHCSAMGFPILGDKIYGTEIPGTRLHLHARKISIPVHDSVPIEVEAGVDFRIKNLEN